MKRLLILVLILTALSAKAEIVGMRPGEWVLNVEQLNYPPSTTLAELLDLMPELLAREGDDRLQNYDIQINGVSCGDSRQAVLIQFQVSDIKEISISKSPSLTQQQKGQGGVINVSLKDCAEGISGGAALKAGLLAEAIPVAKLNWKKGKVLLRSSLMMDFRHPMSNVVKEIREYEGERPTSMTDTIDQHYGYEHAKVTLNWTPDERNSIGAWGWQSFAKDRQETSRLTDVGIKYKVAENGLDNSLSVTAGARYSHKFNDGSSISTQLEYNSSPSDHGYSFKAETALDTTKYTGRNSPRSISGYTNYSRPLISGGTPSICNLTAGVNYSYSKTSTDYDGKEVGIPEDHLNTRAGSLYLSPYAEINSKFGDVFLKGGARYQGLKRNIADEGGDSYNHYNGNVTAFVNFGWTMTPHHKMSLILDRSIVRPSNTQIYPFRIFDPDAAGYTCGNADLTPMSLHNAILGYNFDRSSNGNDFVVSASVQYINAQNIICSYFEKPCIKWKNDGKGDILSANFTTWWRRGPFSLNLNANLFQNWTVLMGAEGNYFYYNLSLIPMFASRKGFRITPKFVYNSHIETQDSRLGDYFLTNLSISKTWNRLTIGVDLSDLFHKTTEDSIFGSAYTKTRFYNLHSPDFAVSAHFTF